jgi:hypothetical protein
VEYTATICPQIAPQPKSATERTAHRLVVVASGALLCVGAWTGIKVLYGEENVAADTGIGVPLS